MFKNQKSILLEFKSQWRPIILKRKQQQFLGKLFNFFFEKIEISLKQEYIYF